MTVVYFVILSRSEGSPREAPCQDTDDRVMTRGFAGGFLAAARNDGEAHALSSPLSAPGFLLPLLPLLQHLLEEDVVAGHAHAG